MEPLTEDEVRETREVLAKLYDPETVQDWNITRRMYDLLGQLIQKSANCTKAMHLVPRPMDIADPAKWAKRQVRQALIRYFQTPETEHYIVCMRAAAWGMRRHFDAAGMGL